LGAESERRRHKRKWSIFPRNLGVFYYKRGNPLRLMLIVSSKGSGSELCRFGEEKIKAAQKAVGG